MKKLAHIVLIGEIVTICLLHAFKSNQSVKPDQKTPAEKPSVIHDHFNKPEYASFRQLASY